MNMSPLRLSFLPILLWLISLPMLVGCQSDLSEQEAQGIFEAEEIMVAGEIDGRLLELSVSLGDRVEQGQITARIDTTLLSYQRGFARGQQGAAQQGANLSAEAQTAAIKEQIAALETERARVSRLVDKEVIAPRQLDELDAKIKVAKAQLQAAENQVGVQSHTAGRQAGAISWQVEQLDELIARATIKAPARGTVIAIYAHQGEIIGAGHPIYKMADLENLTLRVYLRASQLAHIQLGQTIEVFTDMGEKTPRCYQGKVVWISEKAEFTPKNIQTSKLRSELIYAAKVQVKNDGFLKIGQYGKVRLHD